MGRKHVVLIDRSGYGAYRHPDGRPFLDPAEYDVTLVTLPAKADTPEPGEVARVLPANVLDEEAVMAVVPELAAGPPVDHVVAAGERLLIPAARLREALGVPGFRAEQIQLVRHKPEMKRHYGAHGIRTPEFAELSRPLDAAPLLERHGKVILKPVNAMGSAGLHTVDSMAGLRALDAGGLGRPDAYEAEEFIEGVMYHVDSIVADGRALVSVPSLYLEHTSAFRIGGQCRSVAVDAGEMRDRLTEFTARVLGTLGWFSGVTHLEVFHTPDDELVFCEIAGRPGGGGIVPAFAHRFGLNLPVVALLPQLGRPVPEVTEVQPPDRRSIGWSIIYPRTVGVLQEYGELPADDWLIDLKLLKQPGDLLKAPAAVGQALAIATVCGPDAATVTERLNDVQARLRVSAGDPVGVSS
jgi:hypothetical protein